MKRSAGCICPRTIVHETARPTCPHQRLIARLVVPLLLEGRILVGMAQRATAVVLDEDLLAKVKAAAQQAGTDEGAVIEEAVRRFVAGNVLDRLWSRNDLDEDEAMAIATAELAALRASRRAS